jgi:hypothetical protein
VVQADKYRKSSIIFNRKRCNATLKDFAVVNSSAITQISLSDGLLCAVLRPCGVGCGSVYLPMVSFYSFERQPGLISIHYSRELNSYRRHYN